LKYIHLFSVYLQSVIFHLGPAHTAHKYSPYARTHTCTCACVRSCVQCNRTCFNVPQVLTIQLLLQSSPEYEVDQIEVVSPWWQVFPAFVNFSAQKAGDAVSTTFTMSTTIQP